MIKLGVGVFLQLSCTLIVWHEDVSCDPLPPPLPSGHHPVRLPSRPWCRAALIWFREYHRPPRNHTFTLHGPQSEASSTDGRPYVAVGELHCHPIARHNQEEATGVSDERAEVVAATDDDLRSGVR